MSQSRLSQVLAIFEKADRPLSLPEIARDLGVSREGLEGMIQYWVRRGRIHEITSLTDCGTCGESGSCAFVMQMPRTYQLAGEDNLTDGTVLAPGCQHHRVKVE